jgi:16S rRNA (cytidine1402-2'-O)-methyltransferase
MATLYIVATPIGNLGDITFRALEILKSVDIILAEDTRVTRKLLEHYEIQKTVMSYHHHSGLAKIEDTIQLLKEDKNLALVSDAGTPGINDPGNFLIKKILEQIPDLKIVPVPGPNAAMSALSVSGFFSDEFLYMGFPPHKKGRQTFFKKISETDETIVLYESKHRIIKALDELISISEIGEREIMVARELTKQFETIYRGTVQQVKEKLLIDKILGEFIIVIGPKK